jgi:hypothetical protein
LEGKNFLKNMTCFGFSFCLPLVLVLYAVVQKFTGWGIATPVWTNESTRRVTAFFSSPNAVGLYLAPVLMLMIALMTSRLQQYENVGRIMGLLRPATVGLLAMTLITMLAILFTKSQGDMDWSRSRSFGIYIFLWAIKS